MPDYLRRTKREWDRILGRNMAEIARINHEMKKLGIEPETRGFIIKKTLAKPNKST